MAYCSNCGIELNDGAKYCPNCGTSVGGNDRNTPKIKNNNPNQEERLSTWAKIALGFAGFVAFTGVCGGFADGMWVAALSSLCALGAVCAVFMGIIEKKYAWTTAICAFLVVTMAIGLSAPDENGNSNSNSTTTSKQQTEKKQESEAERQAREQKEKESQLAQKRKEVEKKAYEAGYSHGLRQGPITYSRDNPKDAARIYYNTYYGIPSSSEEKEMLNLFLEHYVKGYHDGYKSKEE